MTQSDFSPYAHIATAVFVVDVAADGIPRYCYLNPAAEQATGLSLSGIQGRTALEVHPGRSGEVAYHQHLKAIASGDETTYVLDLNVSGDARIIQTTLVPVLDKFGKVTQMVGTALDASGTAMTREITSTWGSGPSEVEHFVAMAAHDLRTPMRNVQIIADMLREDFEDHGDGKLDLIDLLDDVASKSSELIEGVLEHALSGSVKPERLPFDFGLLCRTMTEVLDPTGQHHFAWTPAALQADKTAIQIALRNLLDNALKHAQRDHVRIDIQARMISTGMIEISVQDNGAGFDNPGQAFLDSGEFRTGSGYGLLGIRRLISARGGKIRVEKGPGDVGSVVRFSLPGTLALIELPKSVQA
jgi:signal transduction histidine kinase